MNISCLRWLSLAFVALTSAVLLSGCVLPGGGYYDSGYYDSGYYDGAVIGGAVYYEPAVIEYYGWEPGYQVGPFHGGENRYYHSERRPDSGGRATAPAYRPAPSTRAVPSIPSRPRSGGSRSREVQPRQIP